MSPTLEYLDHVSELGHATANRMLDVLEATPDAFGMRVLRRLWAATEEVLAVQRGELSVQAQMRGGMTADAIRAGAQVEALVAVCEDWLGPWEEV